MKTFKNLKTLWVALAVIFGAIGLGFLIDLLVKGKDGSNALAFFITSIVAFALCILMLIFLIIIVANDRAHIRDIKKRSKLIVLPAASDKSFVPNSKNINSLKPKQRTEFDYNMPCVIQHDLHCCCTCQYKFDQEQAELSKKELTKKNHHKFSESPSIKPLVDQITDIGLIILKPDPNVQRIMSVPTQEVIQPIQTIPSIQESYPIGESDFIIPFVFEEPFTDATEKSIVVAPKVDSKSKELIILNSKYTGKVFSAADLIDYSNELLLENKSSITSTQKTIAGNTTQEETYPVEANFFLAPVFEDVYAENKPIEKIYESTTSVDNIVPTSTTSTSTTQIIKNQSQEQGFTIYVNPMMPDIDYRALQFNQPKKLIILPSKYTGKAFVAHPFVIWLPKQSASKNSDALQPRKIVEPIITPTNNNVSSTTTKNNNVLTPKSNIIPTEAPFVLNSVVEDEYIELPPANEITIEPFVFYVNPLKPEIDFKALQFNQPKKLTILPAKYTGENFVAHPFVEWPVEEPKPNVEKETSIVNKKEKVVEPPVNNELIKAIEQQEKELVVEAEDLFENEEIVGDDSHVFVEHEEVRAVAMTLKKGVTASLFTGKQNIVFVKRPPIRLFNKIYIIDRASKSIIGEATVKMYERGLKKQIWRKYQRNSTITKDQYDTYYTSSIVACALVIKTVSKYRNPVLIINYGINSVPSTFIYI